MFLTVGAWLCLLSTLSLLSNLSLQSLISSTESSHSYISTKTSNSLQKCHAVSTPSKNVRTFSVQNLLPINYAGIILMLLPSYNIVLKIMLCSSLLISFNFVGFGCLCIPNKFHYKTLPEFTA